MDAEKGLHITVGTFDRGAVLGEGKVTLSREIQMVKAGLLYGDSARLCSIAASLVLSFQRFAENAMSATDVEQCILILGLVEDRIDPRAKAILSQYQALKAKRHKNSHEYLLLDKLASALHEWTAQFHDILAHQAGFAGLNELKRAQTVGLLTIEALDFTETKIKEADDRAAEMVMKRVIDAVEGTNSYPLFDDPVGMIVQAGILLGKLRPSEAAIKRGRQIGTAASLLRDLPHFDAATMDEVLDIRSELERPLVRFRSAIIRLAEGITPAPWDDEFSSDLEQVIQRDIRPVIADLEDAIQANSYMRALMTRVVSDPKKFFSPTAFAAPAGLSLVATGHAGLLQLLAAVAGFAPAAINALDVHYEVKRKREEIERNQMFFYYGARRSLADNA